MAELGSHHEHEAEGVDCANEGVEDPGVPGAVRLVQQRVHAVGRHEREERVAQVAHRLRVVLLRLGFPARRACMHVNHVSDTSAAACKQVNLPGRALEPPICSQGRHHAAQGVPSS